MVRKSRKKENISLDVIVSSFDNNEDLWRPFFTLFFKYWSDCRFTVNLISNYKTASISHPQLRNLQVGKDRKWATNMKKALERVKSDYILYLQDDYFLNKKVNETMLNEGINYLIKKGGACLRLMPSPRPDLLSEDNPQIGKISKEAPFRVSLQAAVWEKEAFKSLLVEGETGWEMERLGSQRSQRIDRPFFSFVGGKDSKADSIPLSYFFIETKHEDCFYTAVNYGFWLDKALDFLKKEGIKVRPLKRPVCSFNDLYLQKKWFSPSAATRTYWKLKSRLKQ